MSHKATTRLSENMLKHKRFIVNYCYTEAIEINITYIVII